MEQNPQENLKMWQKGLAANRLLAAQVDAYNSILYTTFIFNRVVDEDDDAHSAANRKQKQWINMFANGPYRFGR